VLAEQGLTKNILGWWRPVEEGEQAALGGQEAFDVLHVSEVQAAGPEVGPGPAFLCAVGATGS
jgi:hypothetical protein